MSRFDPKVAHVHVSPRRGYIANRRARSEREKSSGVREIEIERSPHTANGEESRDKRDSERDREENAEWGNATSHSVRAVNGGKLATGAMLKWGN